MLRCAESPSENMEIKFDYGGKEIQLDLQKKTVTIAPVRFRELITESPR